MELGYFMVYPSRDEYYNISCAITDKCKEGIPPKMQELYILVEQTNNIIKNLPEFRKDLRKFKMEQRAHKILERKHKRNPDKYPIPTMKKDADLSLRERMEKNNTIKGPNEIKKMYATRLLHDAQAGLVGNQPELAIEAVKILKEEIVLREGGRIKNRNLSALGYCALILGAVSAAVGFFMRLVSTGSILANTPFGAALAGNSLFAYFLVFAGAVAGAWVGYGVENKTVSFEELVNVHKDRIKHVPRLFLFGVSGVLLLLFFNAGIVEINLGNINNAALMSSASYQVLFGAIAGLLGNKLTTGLVEKAADLFDAEDKETKDMTDEEKKKKAAEEKKNK